MPLIITERKKLIVDDICQSYGTSACIACATCRRVDVGESAMSWYVTYVSRSFPVTTLSGHEHTEQQHTIGHFRGQCGDVDNVEVYDRSAIPSA